MSIAGRVKWKRRRETSNDGVHESVYDLLGTFAVVAGVVALVMPSLALRMTSRSRLHRTWS